MGSLLPAAEPAESPGRGKWIHQRRTWEERLAAYLSFMDQQNRAPSQYAEDPGERALFYWLRNQRASFRNGLLLRERIARLDEALPGWSSVVAGGYRTSSGNQARWNSRVDELASFLRQQGRLPRTGPFRPETERALGKWLALQRYALRKGVLRPDRAAHLDGLVPEWRPPPGKAQQES